MTKTYVNIPSNAITVVTANRETVRRRVSMVVSAVLKVVPFAIIQLIEGVQAYVDRTGNDGSLKSADVNLLLRLVRSVGLWTGDPNIALELTFMYDELVTLRGWLEERIAHCETERDNRTMVETSTGMVEKFNPDTYIGLKLILLDVRELMLGEFVKDEY